MHPEDSGSGVFEDEPEIPEEEKRQILEQIERRVEEGIQPSAAELLPRQKGLRFPLIVNLAALLIVAALICGSLLLFRVRRQKLDLETREYASAEGKILDEFKREAQEKLKEKDTAILRVLKQLGALEAEREQLAGIMELRLQEKEREMRSALEAGLEGEKQRLLRAGTSSDALDRLLLEYETEEKRRISRELEAYQQQIDSLSRARQVALLQEKERARLSLEKATQERERLLQETQKQEIELRRRLQAEQGQAAGPGPTAVSIAREQTLLAQERLVTDQICGAFTLIGRSVSDLRYEEASAELAMLKALFRDERLSALPAVRRRQDSDLQIIEALEALIAAATAMMPPVAVAPEEQPVVPETPSEQVEELRKELLEREAEAAARGRALAYEEILTLISRYQEAESQGSREELGREVARRSEGEPLLERLFQAIQGLVGEAEVAPAEPEETYRILGTVTLSRPESVTVLPIVNLSVAVGAKIEIRRILATGESVPVARGTISEVRPGKLVARIDTLAGEFQPSVTDKVYLKVE